MKDVLLHHLSRALTIAQVDDTRYYCNGVLFMLDPSGLTLVASDSQRLYSSGALPVPRVPGTTGTGLVPTKYLKTLVKILKTMPDKELLVEMYPDELLIRIQGIESKMIAGSYPPYEAALPTKITKEVSLDTAKTAKVLKTLLTCADKNKLVKLRDNYGFAKLECFRSGSTEASATLPTTQNEEQLEGIDVIYQGQFLQKILACLDKTECKLEWESIVRPVRISDKSPGFFLLVPTRY
jgi:DNA polymerase-3 subunit beta